MSRNDWTFEFAARQIAAGAAERASYHRDRADFWLDEVDAAKKAIGEAGIDIRSHEITGGQRHEVVIDPTLSRRLDEAQGKHKQHCRDADTYRDWHSVLLVDPDKRLTLDFNDVLFFNLGVREDPEEIAA